MTPIVNCCRALGRGPIPRPYRYDPRGYRLAEAAEPMTLEGLFAAAGLTGPADWAPAPGVLWTREEFLAVPWVAEWRAEWADGELFASFVIDRYGDAIPADVIVLEALTVDFQGIETIGREASWVHELHVHDFTGIGSLRPALHALYRGGWVVPLLDGTVVAPKLILEPIHPR